MLFGGAFVVAILGAFAFKAPAAKFANNAAKPTLCTSLSAFCPGGTTICTAQGVQLQYSDGVHCTGAAFTTP
jgi:hypothetical protein